QLRGPAKTGIGFPNADAIHFDDVGLDRSSSLFHFPALDLCPCQDIPADPYEFASGEDPRLGGTIFLIHTPEKGISHQERERSRERQTFGQTRRESHHHDALTI